MPRDRIAFTRREAFEVLAFIDTALPELEDRGLIVAVGEGEDLAAMIIDRIFDRGGE